MKMKIVLSFLILLMCAAAQFFVDHNAINGDTSASVQQLTEHNQRSLMVTREARGMAQLAIPVSGIVLMALVWFPNKKTAAALLLLSVSGCRRC